MGKEMAALLAKTISVSSEATRTKAEAGKVRRKSKDLEQQLGELESWSKLGMRRNSREYDEDTLKEAFEAIDKDKSGTIDQDELKTAISNCEKNLSDAKVDEMMKFADADGDGKVNFQEFKKVMLMKPGSEEPKTE